MKILALILTILFSQTAISSILVEPQLGYVVSHSADSQLNVTRNGVTSTANVSADGTAAEIGARLGVQYFGFMAGASVVQGASDKGMLTGVFVGYDAPILVRAWAAYHFSSEINYGSTETKGTSIELGAGITALPFLSINLIYRKYNMDEFTINGLDYSTSAYEPTEYVLAVSVPLNFL